MESIVKCKEIFDSFRLDNKHRPAIHIDWDKLSSLASKLLTGLIGRSIQVEAGREEYYYWLLQVIGRSITEDELSILFSVSEMGVEVHGHYADVDIPATELCQQLSMKLISKTLPFAATDSFADDNGVWFLGSEQDNLAGNTPIAQKPYFFTMKVHYKDGREIGTRSGVVFAGSVKEAEDKAWSAYGSDSSCKLEVWEVSGELESFCVYYPKRGD